MIDGAACIGLPCPSIVQRPSRLGTRSHGVQPIEDGRHPLTGNVRHNLTFRRAT
jgi:hypothetical protein